MPTKYTIASLNRLIIIQHIALSKNVKGLPVKQVVSQQTTYAYFQQVSNSYSLQQMQVAFGEAWEAIVRYEPSRLIAKNDIILYAGRTYSINGIEEIQQGNMQWVRIVCALENNN